MTHIPEDVLKDVKSHLENERLRLQESLSSLKTQDPYSDPDRLNDNAASDTEANEENSHDRMEALEKELTQSLDEIQHAYLRIEQGTYGVCQSCGNHIDTDRLSVKPTALYCVECERKKEK